MKRRSSLFSEDEWVVDIADDGPRRKKRIKMFSKHGVYIRRRTMDCCLS